MQSSLWFCNFCHFFLNRKIITLTTNWFLSSQTIFIFLFPWQCLFWQSHTLDGPCLHICLLIIFKEHHLEISFLNHRTKIVRTHDSNINDDIIIWMFYTILSLLINYVTLKIIKVQKQNSFACIIGIWHFSLLL